MNILPMAIMLFATLLAGVAHGGEFTTNDPVKAFVQREYPLGDDYFINGNEDTHILRCLLTTENQGFGEIALSELSIWGNRTGPWEIFKKQDDGKFVYVETRHLTDTSCTENCRTKEYLASGRCVWKHGWPK